MTLDYSDGGIFVSYSREDIDLVYPLADKIRLLGYDVWTDVTGIVGGSVWHTEIEKALIQCDVVIVMISYASMKSEWVRKEVLHALDLKKNIIPVLIDRIPMPFILIELQPINYINNPDKAVHDIISTLTSLEVTKSSLPQFTDNPVRETRVDAESLLALRRYLASPHPPEASDNE